MRSDFWFRAKKDLLLVLMGRILTGSRKERIKILNAGAGTGDEVEVLARFGSVFVTDINPAVLALVPRELCVDIQVADIGKLPYQDAEFDVVVALDVFEHISDEERAVAEVRRVLKPGGHLVFTVPAFQWLWSARDVALQHKRRYNKKMLKKLFSAFHSNYLAYWNFVLFFPISIQRLFGRNSKPHVESIQLPKFVNTFFYRLMGVDTFCVEHQIPLPVGISLVGWCRK